MTEGEELFSGAPPELTENQLRASAANALLEEADPWIEKRLAVIDQRAIEAQRVPGGLMDGVAAGLWADRLALLGLRSEIRRIASGRPRRNG
jgi:hypothetical protein